MADVECHYTFYSHSSGSKSWIDLFLTNKKMLLATLEAQIGLITWSDHAPISVELFPQPCLTNHSIWRLNSFLLTNPQYDNQIQFKLKNFFWNNCEFISDQSMVWLDHKAFVRGLLIKFGAQERKRQSAVIDLLLHQIKTLEQTNKFAPTQTTSNIPREH